MLMQLNNTTERILAGSSYAVSHWQPHSIRFRTTLTNTSRQRFPHNQIIIASNLRSSNIRAVWGYLLFKFDALSRCRLPRCLASDLSSRSSPCRIFPRSEPFSCSVKSRKLWFSHIHVYIYMWLYPPHRFELFEWCRCWWGCYLVLCGERVVDQYDI